MEPQILRDNMLDPQAFVFGARYPHTLLDSTSTPIYALTAHTLCALIAPMAAYNHHLKRTSSVAQFDEPAAKKLHRAPTRHHKAVWDLQREQRYNATILGDEDVQSLLTRSIGLALEAVGFEAAAPDAIESFRGDVEECMR